MNLMLRVYNTLTRKKEVFKPRKPGKVNLFVCGPTVYDFAHLGHAKTYIFFDLFSKYLREKGFKVFYLQNITDIDDKIIKRAAEKKISPRELAQEFEKKYYDDMKALKVAGVTKYAPATKHIEEIISQVKRLIKKRIAYQIEDGVYYDIGKFKDYGKLSKRTVLQAEDGVSRIDEAKGKKNKGDFCLWKFSKPDEPKWKSAFGEGRPGWHIEDTAITEKYFGPQYDVHGGGQDLMFPHHEAEIAQMEAISGKKPLVKYWSHVGFLTVNGEKMAKSLGNFITIRDFLKQNSGRVLRLFFLKNHYRSPVDYNENNIHQTEKELEKIDDFVGKLKSRQKTSTPSRQNLKLVKEIIDNTKQEFYEALDDDFNTALALAVLFKFINQGNQLLAQNKIGKNEAKIILNFFRNIDKFLNFIFWPEKKEKIPALLYNLLEEREKARKEKNWQKADEIRKEIEKLGYKIEDVLEGPKIKKA